MKSKYLVPWKFDHRHKETRRAEPQVPERHGGNSNTRMNRKHWHYSGEDNGMNPYVSLVRERESKVSTLPWVIAIS